MTASWLQLSSLQVWKASWSVAAAIVPVSLVTCSAVVGAKLFGIVPKFAKRRTGENTKRSANRELCF